MDALLNQLNKLDVIRMFYNLVFSTMDQSHISSWNTENKDTKMESQKRTDNNNAMAKPIKRLKTNHGLQNTKKHTFGLPSGAPKRKADSASFR